MKNILEKVNSLLNILNEDMFAKYTTKQIYDELGKEEFLDYVEKCTEKAIKNVLPNQEFKTLARRQSGETTWLGFGCETIPDKYVVISETFVVNFDFNNIPRGVGLGLYGLYITYSVSLFHQNPDSKRSSKPLATHYPITEYVEYSDINISGKIKELVEKVYNSPTAKKIRNKFKKLNDEVNQKYKK